MPDQARNDAQPFGEVVDLAEQMLRRAHAGDWEGVTRINREREDRIARYFARPPADSDEALRAQIRRLLDIDGEIAAMGKKTLDLLSAQITELNKGRKASRAYAKARAY